MAASNAYVDRPVGTCPDCQRPDQQLFFFDSENRSFCGLCYQERCDAETHGDEEPESNVS